MLFAGMILLLFLLVFRKEQIRITNNTLKIAGLGLLLGLHWIFFYGSIKYANVSVGVVCFCLSGFFTALLAPWMNKTRLSVIELLLSGLTIAGILLIFKFDSSFRTGILLGTISACLFSVFAILNERVNKENDPVRTTTLEMLGGALGIGLFLPVYLYFVPVKYIIPTPQDAGLLLALAFFCTVIMCIQLNKAQRIIPAFTVNLNFNLEPLYGIGLAVLIFQENKELTSTFYIGLALILASLALQMTRLLLFKEKA